MGVTTAILNQKSIEMSFQFHLSKSKAESWHRYLPHHQSKQLVTLCLFQQASQESATPISAGVLVCCIYALMLQTVMQRTA